MTDLTHIYIYISLIIVLMFFLLLLLSYSGRLVGQVKCLDGAAVVFWVREASLTCRTSPVTIKKTTRFTIFYLLLRMIYLWFVAQKVLNRLYYALHGNPALTKAQADTFVADLKFNDIQTIVKALRRKFPSRRTRITKWGDRAPKSNKTLDWLTTINHMMNLVSGEEPGQLLQVYMKQTHTASKLTVDDITSNTQLVQHLVVQCNAARPTNNTEVFFRRNVLKALSSTYSCAKLKDAGLVLTKEFWKEVRKDCKDHGLDFWVAIQRGRKSITPEQQAIICAIVMTDKYTSPLAGATHAVDDARALITSRANIYRKEEKLREIWTC
jgi:hypothetical protein